MKKILSLMLTLGAAVAVHAQGTFLPATWSSDPGGTYAGGVITDSTVSGVGPGGKGLAYGSAYQAQYYIGPANTTDANALTAVGPVTGFLGTSATDQGGGAGFWEGNGNAAISTSFAGGTTVTLQLRAWKVSSGSTYDTAGVHGSSALLQVVLGNAGSPPTPATSITSMPNFAVAGPEPATMALGLMGAGALFFRRRK